MRNKVKYSPKKVISAIKGSGGIKMTICQRLGCTRPTLDAYLRDNEEIRKAFIDEQEEILDMAEINLYGNIQNGDLTAIFYILNNKGHKRGYGPKAAMYDMQSSSTEDSGVLVTPGMFTEEAWEEQAKKN